MKSVVKSAKTIDLAIAQGLKELNCSFDDVKVTIIEHPKSGIFGIIGQKDAVVKLELKEDKDHLSNFVGEVLDEGKKEEKREQRSVNMDQPTKHVYVSKNNGKKKKAKDIKKKDPEIKEEEIVEKEIVQREIKEEPKKVSEDENLEVINFIKDFVGDLLEKIHINAEVKVEIHESEVYVDLDKVEEGDVGVVIGKKAETLNSLQYITALALNKKVDNFYRVFLNIAGYRERRKNQIESLAIKRAKTVLRNKKQQALKPMNSYERKIVHFTLQNIDGIETVSEGKDPYRKVVIKYTK